MGEPPYIRMAYVLQGVLVGLEFHKDPHGRLYRCACEDIDRLPDTAQKVIRRREYRSMSFWMEALDLVHPGQEQRYGPQPDQLAPNSNNSGALADSEC